MAIINQGQVILEGKSLQLTDQIRGQVYQKTIRKGHLSPRV